MFKSKIKQNVDISSFSTFNTKAKTKHYFEINNHEDVLLLEDLGRFCEDNNLRIFVLGKGTNILFAFDEFDGLIIKNNLKGWKYDENTKLLEANSGELISNIAAEIKDKYKNNIWERFIGLPGTIGAAVFGNAGCFGLEAGNNFVEAKVLNIKTGQIELFNKEQMKFEYRRSILKENIGNYFIISIIFDLSKVIEKYSSEIDIVKFRLIQQPKGYTGGSFFKNPNKETPAGLLIEEVGLKGFKKGGAFFSEKHGNFLMSDGNAKYEDLLELIDLAIESVKKEKNILLEPEVKILRNI